MRFERALVESVGADWSAAYQANVALDDLSTLLVDQIDAADYVDSKTAWKFACLHQALAYRVVDLAEATIFLWANKRWLMSVIAARSVLETIALAHHVVSITETAVEAKDIAKLDEIVMQQTFSQKTGEHGLPATNVLTAIDRLAKYATDARGYYDALSEFTHPNSNGHYFFYSELDTDQHVTKFSRGNDGLGTFKRIAPALVTLMLANVRLSAMSAMLRDIRAMSFPA